MSVIPTRCVTEARWLSRGRLSCGDCANATLDTSSSTNPNTTGTCRLYTGVLLKFFLRWIDEQPVLGERSEPKGPPVICEITLLYCADLGWHGVFRRSLGEQGEQGRKNGSAAGRMPAQHSKRASPHNIGAPVISG